MYRMFCESYKYYHESFSGNDYRSRLATTFRLLTDQKAFEEAKKYNSDEYIELCALLTYMSSHLSKYPRFEAFSGMLEARGMLDFSCSIYDEDKLAEQAQLLHSFLKGTYWK